jgi:hypothetical protein
METAQLHVARMSSGDIEFCVEGPIIVGARNRFYMTEADTLDLLDKIKAVLIDPD